MSDEQNAGPSTGAGGDGDASDADPPAAEEYALAADGEPEADSEGEARIVVDDESDGLEPTDPTGEEGEVPPAAAEGDADEVESERNGTSTFTGVDLEPSGAAGETDVEDASAEDTAVEDASVDPNAEETSAEEADTQEAGEASADEQDADERDAGEADTGDASADEASADGASADDASVDEASADDTSAEAEGAASPDDEADSRAAAEASASDAAVVAPVAAVAAARGTAARSTEPSRTMRSGAHDALGRLRGRRSRGRFGREAVGIAVLVVLALICAGLIVAVIVKTRHDSAVAAQEAAAYTPPPLATASPSAAGPSVTIIGDDGVDQAAAGVSAADRWPALLAKDLHGSVDPVASAGMGFVSTGSSNKTFVDEASAVSTSADVIVFFGGVADADGSSSSTGRAAVDAFAAAAKRAPRATVVVVGPV